MKSRFVLSFLALLLLIGMGSGYYYFRNPKVTISEFHSETPLAIQDRAVASEERYKMYDEETFSPGNSDKTVLFFYASWCASCQLVDAEIRAHSTSLPSDMTIVRVNFDEKDADAAEKDLAVKYGVTEPHTFVQIDDKGNIIKQWNGGDLNTLLAGIE